MIIILKNRRKGLQRSRGRFEKSMEGKQIENDKIRYYLK